MAIEEGQSLKTAIESLLENFLINRKDDSELFREICSHEKTIRKYMMTNFGYQLKLDSEVAKLEKTPYYSREWMGIQHFKDELDYVFLMAVLATLETKAFDDGFLLSNLTEDVKKFLLDVHEVDWKIRHQRESLSRALLYAQEAELIKIRDGELVDFERSEEGEVLYESKPLIRYHFRNFSKRISDYQSLDDMLLDGLEVENPRHSIFRKLYFEPVVFFGELTEEEKTFINEKRNYDEIKEQIENFTFFELERMYQSIFLVNSERKQNLKQHPSRKHESYIVSQVAFTFLNRLRSIDDKPMDLLVLKNSEFEEVLKEAKDQFQLGWTSKMRELSFAKFKQMVLEYMIEWKLATYEEETMRVTIYPPFIRAVGDYDADLKNFIEEENLRRKRNDYNNEQN